jgi:Right handed beta helix region
MKPIYTIHHFLKLAALACVATLSTVAARAVDYHVATAQDLQNYLTLAAGNGANNNIWLTNGYYSGTFSYSSTANFSLNIMSETNLNNTQVTIDGGGGGVDLNINCSGATSGNVTVSNITFMRNCGSSTVGALRIAGSGGATIIATGCRFLSTSTSLGMGLVIASGDNTTIANCIVIGKTNGSVADGDGINISSVTGTTLMFSNTVIGNYVGNGADITSSSILSLSNNIFQANYSDGLLFDQSGSTKTAVILITNNVFITNGVYGSAVEYFGTANVDNNIFTGNVQGGLALENGITGSAVGNTFYKNGVLNGDYGGLFDLTLNTAITTGNTFTLNLDGYGGAGALFQSVGTNTVTGNTFSGNSAEYAVGGGGAAIQSPPAASINIFSNNTFNVNSAIGPGGGLSCYSSGSAIVIVNNNTFTGNSCSGNNGGGALYLSAGTNTITANTFVQNSSADGGGAIYASSPGGFIMSDNLIVSNSQSGASATGGGIYVNPVTNLFIINNTIFDNNSGGGGGGAAFSIGTTQNLYVFNNIIWGNTATGNGADVYLAGGGQLTELQYDDVNSLYGVWDITTPSINVDPVFFNAVGGDYHLQTTSPCLNVGTNNPAFLPLTDLDGNVRTNKLGQVDLGCYEFNDTAPHPADTNASFTITFGEFNSYAAAWKAGQNWSNAPASAPNPLPIPANYLTRAGYLMTNGGFYTNNGSARPTDWVTNTP